MLRCPVCGGELNGLYLRNSAEKRTTIINGEEVTQLKCNNCGSFMTPIKLKYDFKYYQDKSQELYGTPWRDESVILEEIKEYGLFDNEKHEVAERALSEWCNNYLQREQQIRANENAPRCPTCGSTNIGKISAASKVVGASLFGLLSKTARSQFKCNNCGYKW